MVFGKKAAGKGFGPAAQKAFLAHLAQTANVSASAKTAGVTTRPVYDLRKKSEQFCAQWLAALSEGYARLEANLLSEALSAPASNMKDSTFKQKQMKTRIGMALLAAHNPSRKREGDISKEKIMDYEVKADPLEAAFDAAVIPAAVVRPQLAAGNMADPARSAFVEDYLRKGREVELKSFAGNVPADGGYAVPKEIDAVIDATLKSISPIRAVANVVQVGSAGYRKLVTTNGVASGWASEVAARPTTATPTFNEIVPSFGELYANPAATQAMLDDAQFDVEAWLADEIATQFAKAEGTAFVNGDGVDKPKGFLAYTAVATGDTSRAFGQLQYVPVGAASDFPATNPQDKLLDLVHALRAPYRQGAVWVMNSATLAKIRKFKTSDGAFVWTPGLVTGQPDTLLGYPVVESEDMPDIAANSMPIAFGNFRAGYLIAERSETNILRDPYSNKPYVNFYATKRIGGAVSNSEAIKLLRIAAS